MIPERYNTDNLVRAVNNPSKIGGEIKRMLRWPAKKANKRMFIRKYGSGTDVMSKDWDNLIILDACRYDIFSQYSDIQGELNSIVSVGSTSNEFIKKTFMERTFQDVVYVSANGFSHKLDSNIFHEFVSTYDESQRNSLNQDLYKNYHPKKVRNKAIQAYKRNKNKKFIIHFMQPHGPYFGKEAKEYREKIRDKRNTEFSAWNSETNATTRSEEVIYLMDAVKKGYISSEELREVYVENLSIVLDYVEDLINNIDGKTVITADHGELFGLDSFWYNTILGVKYEHPGYVWIPELRIVPWLVIPSNDRRNIIEESPVSGDELHEELIEEHLQALGYKN